MNLSDHGVQFIVYFEGKLKLRPDGRYESYRCPAGVLTIYVGCTDGVTEGMICTEAEGLEMLKHELRQHISGVNDVLKVPVRQNEFDACVSFSYNCGLGALKQSTLLRKLNAGDFSSAAAEFARWDKVHGAPMRGLTRRRAAERELFETPDESPHEYAPPLATVMPQAVDPVPHKEWHQSKTILAQAIAVPAMVSGYVGQLKSNMDQVSQTASDANAIGLAHVGMMHFSAPTLLLGLAGIGALAFCLKERLLKLVEGV
jgi:lysozyme